MRGDVDLQRRLQSALAECESLRKEIRQLKQALHCHSSPVPEATRTDSLFTPEELGAPIAPVSKEGRIELFRSLFRGREDVYAERWEARDGRSGYQPASRKNWEAIFTGVPNFQAELLRSVATDDMMWTEWRWHGTRTDGSAFEMR